MPGTSRTKNSFKGKTFEPKIITIIILKLIGQQKQGGCRNKSTIKAMAKITFR